MSIALGAGEQSPIELVRETELSRRNLAETVALAVIMEQDGGLSATETHFSPELIRVGFHCPGFALPGDLIWEFRRCEWLSALKDILWINVRTAQVLWWWRKGPVPEVFAYPRSVLVDFEGSRNSVRFADFNVETNELLRNLHVSTAFSPLHGVKDPNKDGDVVLKSSGNADGRIRPYWTKEPSSELENGKPAIQRAMAIERIFGVAGSPKLTGKNDIAWDAKLTQASKSETGFCAAHDLLWDVRLVHPGEDGIPVIQGEYLVHAQTGAIFCIIAQENVGGTHGPTESVPIINPP
jgi:hypothetical protein